jgi:phosphotransferase system enzyme I (PtsI)
MAGDPRYTRLLLGLGLTQFSMHPSALLEIKKIVRESTLAELRELTERIMQAHDTRELHQLVEDMNGM